MLYHFLQLLDKSNILGSYWFLSYISKSSMLVKLASSLGGGVVAGFFLCRSIEDKPILDVVSAKSNPILEDEFRPSTKWDWNWDKLVICLLFYQS